MTLGCLAPYRRLGIGTRMLEHVLNIVKEDGNYTSIFLHVQVIQHLDTYHWYDTSFNIFEDDRCDSFPRTGKYSNVYPRYENLFCTLIFCHEIKVLLILTTTPKLQAFKTSKVLMPTLHCQGNLA